MIPRTKTKYVAGEVLDMKIYDCAVNTAAYGQQTYIQQITPDFDIETLDQQVWVQGKISMYRGSSARQNLVYAALDVSTNGFTSFVTLCSVPQTMDSGDQTYASYQFSHIHVPAAVGTHAYRIRLYSPSNLTILLGIGNNNGCQMTFLKKFMPAARLTTNTLSNWTFNTTAP
jgi:hypothetical protein